MDYTTETGENLYKDRYEKVKRERDYYENAYEELKTEYKKMLEAKHLQTIKNHAIYDSCADEASITPLKVGL